MADTSAPDKWKAFQGFALVVFLASLTFAAAGLGWHAGAALARVLGL